MSEKPFCPNDECGSAHIARRTQKPDGGIPKTRWHCKQCKAEFDKPKMREPTSRTGLTGMAKMLDELDPDKL